MKAFLETTMPDGSIWRVPVEVIARDRATHYAREFGGDIERSLQEDTIPLFETDDYEIEDWAANNMLWEDVQQHAYRVADPTPPEINYQEGWTNGEKRVVRENRG
jgi:hypothetical protein